MVNAQELWSRMKDLYHRRWELIDQKLSVGLAPPETRELARVTQQYEQVWRDIMKEEKANPTIRVFGRHKDCWEPIPAT